MAVNFTENEINLLLYAFFPHKRRFDFEAERFDFLVIFICENGRFEYSVDDIESGIASTGDAVFCPAGKTLRRRILEPVSLHVIRFELNKPPADKLPTPEKLPAGKFRIADFDRIKSDLGMIQNHNILQRFLPYERHYLLDVLYTIINQFGLLVDEPISDCIDPTISAVINEIKRNLREKLTVKSIADEFGLTPVAFIRRFKKAVGKTPMNYIINLRMKTAIKLLGETKKSLSEIASACGYENEYYFSNSFKRNTGQSPSDFRNSMKV